MRSDLERLERALVRLRRLWESPPMKRRLLESLGRPVELSLIRTLRAIDWAEGDSGVRQVAETLLVDSSTASRFVDQAVAAGCVKRSTSERDRRCSVLTLTEEGRALLDDVTAVRARLLAEMTEDWSGEDVATLSRLLERLSS
jgi:DNA-binding MarR family transcriptional regulator